MSALDDCHALAALLWPDANARFVSRVREQGIEATINHDGGRPLTGAQGPTPEAAAEALAVALRAKAIARGNEMLRAAGEPQPADRGVRGGARLDDAALRDALGFAMRLPSHAADVGKAVRAIREAERRSDERHEPVEGVAQGVERHVVMDGIADAAPIPSGLVSRIIGDRIIDVLRLVPDRDVRVVVEVLP